MHKMFIPILILICFSCKEAINNGNDPKIKEKEPSLQASAVAIAVANAGFEANGATQTPGNWSTSGANADADYTQSRSRSGTYCLSHWKSSAYKVYTSQTLTGLSNGYYSFSAWIQNGGGQNACYLSAKDFGSDEKMTSLPVSSTWIKVIVRGINVTNGKVTIGFYSDANAGNWVNIDDIELIKDDKPYTFLKGGDLSELSYIESKGGKFYEGGIQKDCFTILKNNGFNIARLRLYNDPGNPNFSPSKRLPAGYQNPTDILNLSRRAKAAGMQIQLTFHYSDYWTNAVTQNKPHDWANLSYTALKTAVYDFTYNFLNQMKAQGTIPEFVSLGNEMHKGILFPDGPSSKFNQLAELLNQGYNAVKAVSPSTKVILHLDDAGNSGKYDNFFGQCAVYNAKYDVIGASYYPFWTKKTVAQIRDWANYVANKFNKDIMIMETGYNWNPTLPDGSAGQLTDNGPYNGIYPSSPDGQKNFMYDCFNGLKSADNGRVIGNLYWDPVMIAVPGVGWELGGKNVVSNTTLFDFKGNSLSVLKAYKYNN